jgi:hypothetical protein
MQPDQKTMRIVKGCSREAKKIDVKETKVSVDALEKVNKKVFLFCCSFLTDFLVLMSVMDCMILR